MKLTKYNYLLYGGMYQYVLFEEPSGHFKKWRHYLNSQFLNKVQNFRHCLELTVLLTLDISHQSWVLVFDLFIVYSSSN